MWVAPSMCPASHSVQADVDQLGLAVLGQLGHALGGQLAVLVAHARARLAARLRDDRPQRVALAFEQVGVGTEATIRDGWVRRRRAASASTPPKEGVNQEVTAPRLPAPA